jgi:peptidyl-prolyl cis-trans isomerase SurA
MTEGIYEEGSSAIPKIVTDTTKVTAVYQNGTYYYVTKLNKILPPATKTFDEAKGKIINDYQQSLEENWVSELKKEFTVKVNENVFEKTKRKIKK